MERVITIIGGGASSVSLIAAILDEIRHRSGVRLTIFLVEKRSSFGRGLAYAGDSHSNLLNTRAGSITPFSDKPGHFFAWLSAKRDLWEDDFPTVPLDPEAFVPRALFGLYLEHMMSDLVEQAIARACTLIPVHAEATGVSYGHDGRLVVTTNTSLAFQSDHVVLSCGNVGSTEYGALEMGGAFFPSPYPVKRLVRRIPAEAAVGVLGSRLSAIDAVLGLAGAGHDGPIAVHSRTGALPCVRGIQGRYKPRVLTPEAVEAHLARHGMITLDEVVSLVSEEMEAAGVSVRNFDPAHFCAQASPVAFLRAEIAAAGRPRPWQAVLYATNGVIDRLWQAMPREDRRRFWPYVSWWMSYRVSIPVENAQKLLALAEAGRFTVVPGSTRLTRTDAGFEIEAGARGEVVVHRYDAVVAATGTPRDAHLMDSRLIQDLIAKGLGTCHEFGGLTICPETGGLADSRGRVDPRVTALGELTSGTYFFTSVLEINARHAARRAAIIVSRLASSASPVGQPAERRLMG